MGYEICPLSPEDADALHALVDEIKDDEKD